MKLHKTKSAVFATVAVLIVIVYLYNGKLLQYLIKHKYHEKKGWPTLQPLLDLQSFLRNHTTLSPNFNLQISSSHMVPQQSASTQKPAPCDTVILTMFTTFRNDAYKNVSNINVLHNWALLQPCVQPILFVQAETDHYIKKIAKDNSWIVEDVPRVSPSGIPIFKDLFFRAMELAESEFYAYSNGDILYDETLVHTVVALAHDKGNFKHSLIIGKRKNYPLMNETLYKLGDVSAKLKTSDFFQTNAQDYFIINDENFPWVKIPDVVVGRPGYDNFVVSVAIQDGVTVIDGSVTIGALHQTSSVDGDHAGFTNQDALYNHQLIGRYRYPSSTINSAPYVTQWDQHGVVVVKKR